MLIQTNQFGAQEIEEHDIIHFPKGVLGFETQERFALIEPAETKPFRWLQCVDEPALAFVIVSPIVFFPHYRVAVHAKEVADIDVLEPQDVQIFVIVTIPEQVEQISANLQGPILINTRAGKAKQLVLTNSEYTVQHLFVNQLSQLLPLEERSVKSAVEFTR